MLESSYNALLVTFSFLVAILASYTALSMAGRISKVSGTAVGWWLCGGAFAMGLGVWAMHFIGMLAFSLPIPLGYDAWLTALSLAVAVASSGFALWVACRRRLTMRRLCAGALVMGAGVAGMHYLGMEAMMMTPRIVYDPAWFTLSLVIAVSASGAALWITHYLKSHSSRRQTLKLLSAVVMGCAIVGMHYSGMAAARFAEGSMCGAAFVGVDTHWLSILVTLVTVAVLSIALVVSMLENRYASRSGELHLSLREANRALEHMALHDVLTHLPNRALIEDRIEQAMQAAQRGKSSFAILFMDLDGFKRVNDTYGHAIGDLLLMEAARRIQAAIPEHDTVARFGGDEFVVLSLSSAAQDTAAQAETIVSVLSQPFEIRGLRLLISTSIGIAFYPENGLDVQDLLVNADAAMYHRKENGRNGYSFFDPSMNASAAEHLQLVHDLRQAVSRKQLVLHFQAQINTATGQVQGAEALVRWKHPQHGLMAPESFFTIAEKTGLIVDIDNWTLNEACRQLHQWSEKGYEGTVSIHVSHSQFVYSDLPENVRKALLDNAIPPGRLVLQIDEESIMRNADNRIRTLQKLHELGVKVSIDNFGAGSSNLLHLKRIAAYELKIDGRLISNITTDATSHAVVEAIVALGRVFQLKVIAKGVEAQEQQQRLHGLGCHHQQGYLLAPPVPGKEFPVSQPDLSQHHTAYQEAG